MNLEASKSCTKPEGQHTKKISSLSSDKNIFRDVNYPIYKDNTRSIGETRQDIFAEEDGGDFFPGKKWKLHLLNHLELVSALGKGNDPLLVPRRHMK